SRSRTETPGQSWGAFIAWIIHNIAIAWIRRTRQPKTAAGRSAAAGHRTVTGGGHKHPVRGSTRLQAGWCRKVAVANGRNQGATPISGSSSRFAGRELIGNNDLWR